MGSKTKIHWKSYLLELLVVVIGIFIAFQLDSYSKQKSNRQKVETHLGQLVQEAKYNRKSIEFAVETTEKNIATIDSLFVQIEKGEDVDLINQLSIQLLSIRGLYIRKNAYSALFDTGDVGLMKNLDKRQEIINLYEFYDWVKSYDRVALDSYNQDFYPYIKENFDFVTNEPQPLEVYRQKKFLNSLATYKFMSQNKLTKYKECLIEVDDFIDFFSN